MRLGNTATNIGAPEIIGAIFREAPPVRNMKRFYRTFRGRCFQALLCSSVPQVSQPSCKTDLRASSITGHAGEHLPGRWPKPLTALSAGQRPSIEKKNRLWTAIQTRLIPVVPAFAIQRHERAERALIPAFDPLAPSA